ncbi:MAG: DUF87 domain-containing protein [Bacteroidota bacterium]
MDFDLGDIIRNTLDGNAVAALDQHVKDTDNKLHQEYTNKGMSKEFERLLNLRFFTYIEYLSLFDSAITKDEFHQYGIFLFLRIEEEYGYWKGNERINGRKDFISFYEPNEMGFIQLLKKVGFSFSKINASIAGEKLRAKIPYKRMWEHIYINGASGSGKSTLMKRLIWLLSKLKVGIVLIDPQGKLASEVRSFKQIDKDRLVYFKPTLKEGYTSVLNFLDNERGKDANSMALRLARVISILSKGELSPPMVSLLRPCLAVMIEKGGYNLTDLKRFLIKEENEDLIELGLAHADPEYRSTFKRLNSGYFNRTRDAIISKLDLVLQDKVFRDITSGKSTINLRQSIEQGKIIIFDLGRLDTDTIQAFGRLVVALSLHIALERNADTIKKYKRFFLFIDEMQNFLSPDMIKIVDEARQKKLHLVMAHQRIGQLKAHLKTNVEENFIDAMMGNTAVKIVGHNDSPDTINILSSKLGMDKEKLIGIPNYEFMLRVRGKTDVHFKSSNAINSKGLYLTKKETKELDEYMLQKYYTPISMRAGSAQGFKREAAQSQKDNKNNSEPIKMQVDLEEDDF